MNRETTGRRRDPLAGYTLLELLAVMTIVLVAGVAVISGIQSIRRASLTTSAATLAAAVRYLYDLSVLNNLPYKMVIDLQSGEFEGRAVTSPGGCPSTLLPSQEEMEFGGLTQRETVEGEGSPGGVPSERRAARAGLKDNLLKRRKLPKGISFSGVVTTHDEEIVTEGTAEVYFFPSGYVEKALIYLKKGDEVYTVETEPLRGVAVVTPEEVDYRAVMQ